jgi:hypothetical protein
MKNRLSSILRTIFPPLLLVSLGFIMCMHWFLLMADSLAGAFPSGAIPASVIESIIAYYTIVFGPMTWLIKVVILAMTLSIILQLFIRDVPRVLSWTIAIIKLPLIANGVFYIIPLVGKFISESYTPEEQSQIIQSAHASHLWSAIGTVIAILLQLIIVIRLMRPTEEK